MKKNKLKKKIEREKEKSIFKEAKLRGKINNKKEILKLERELEEAKKIDIPEEDMKLLEEDNKFKDISKSLFIGLKNGYSKWAKKQREEREKQREKGEW